MAILTFDGALLTEAHREGPRDHGRWEKREEIRRRVGVIRRKLSPEMKRAIMQEMGRIGGAMPKRFRTTKKQRQEQAQNAAAARWRRSRGNAWWSKPLGA
jgi:hypothetical protein